MRVCVCVCVCVCARACVRERLSVCLWNTGSPVYSPLEEVHIFTLAQVLRRPVVVIADKHVYGASLGPIAPIYYSGVYLPLLVPAELCSRVPVLLTYLNSHFCGLVAMDTFPLQTIWRPPRQLSKQAVHFSNTSGKGNLLRFWNTDLAPRLLVNYITKFWLSVLWDKPTSWAYQGGGDLFLWYVSPNDNSFRPSTLIPSLQLCWEAQLLSDEMHHICPEDYAQV